MGGKKESGESTVATPDLNNYPLISRRCRGSLSIILECVEQVCYSTSGCNRLVLVIIKQLRCVKCLIQTIRRCENSLVQECVRKVWFCYDIKEMKILLFLKRALHSLMELLRLTCFSSCCSFIKERRAKMWTFVALITVFGLVLLKTPPKIALWCQHLRDVHCDPALFTTD